MNHALIPHVRTPNFPKNLKFLKAYNFHNCSKLIIKLVICYWIHYLNYLFGYIYFIEQFFSVYWLVSLLQPQGRTVMNFRAYLAFELMQKVFMFLQTTGKKFGCYLSLILKQSYISLLHKNNSVKNIKSKHFPKLIEVNSLNCLSF